MYDEFKGLDVNSLKAIRASRIEELDKLRTRSKVLGLPNDDVYFEGLMLDVKTLNKIIWDIEDHERAQGAFPSTAPQPFTDGPVRS